MSRITIFALTAALGLCRIVAAAEHCELSLRLVDANSGEILPGVVQIADEDGALVELSDLVARGQGIEQRGPIHDWWVLSQVATLELPQRRLRVRAFAGLESEIAAADVDLRGRTKAELKLPLKRFYDARHSGYVAGNTHLHLMKLSKAQADRYLREVPLADGLDIVFLSYLERANDDLEYTSNKYSPEELARLAHGPLRYGHGEEHRHNFDSHGEGYGHILLLDIPYIIRPVSIGPGITKQGTDAPPLQDGIDEAKQTGGRVVWAHNKYGFEDIPNWLTGRVDANNIFDGGTRGSYRDSFYRYLNVGLHVPFSSGTDWFIYDFSRVYVTTDKAVTPTEWLALLAAGRSFITNGPLLEFTVDEQPVGSTLELPGPRRVHVRGRALGRIDFARLELVQNGTVIEKVASHPQDSHFAAGLELDLEITSPCWLALRTPPPPVANDPELQSPVPANEFGGPLFAHTSPVYIDLAGRGVFDRRVAEGLLAEMQASLHEIAEHAKFADEAERRRVVRVYEAAIGVLSEAIEQGSLTDVLKRD